MAHVNKVVAHVKKDIALLLCCSPCEPREMNIKSSSVQPYFDFNRSSMALALFPPAPPMVKWTWRVNEDKRGCARECEIKCERGYEMM